MNMRLAALMLAAGVALMATPGQTQEIGDFLKGLGRALTPQEEQDRSERRRRYDDYERDWERRRDAPYAERYEPEEDRFWSEAARALNLEGLTREERDRYDSMSDSERRRFDEDLGYDRRDWYEQRASDEERRRYDRALEEAEDDLWRRRRN